MAKDLEQVVVPDIGGAEDVDVIEILVKPGDHIALEDSLITLESDKASMEVPAPVAGIIEEIQLNIGDKVSEGSAILTVKKQAPDDADKQAEKTVAQPKATEQSKSSATQATQTQSVQEVRVPDMGDVSGVEVIEVSVAVGDQIKQEDPIITLEGEKASMEVPSPLAGEVTEIKAKVGDHVAAGDLILLMKAESSGEAPAVESTQQVAEKPATNKKQQASHAKAAAEEQQSAATAEAGKMVHAGPGVRRIAREFDVDLTKLQGSGEKGRIVKEDVQQFVKSQLRIAEAGGGAGLAVAPPKVDFTKFGDVETQPLSKIKKLSGVNLHRNWVSIPHVTQFGEADTTEMEAFRQAQKELAKQRGIKLTPLVFIMKAVVAALKQYPIFNASLDESQQNLVLKKYYHIGVAVDTPNGLVVPVIRDVDQKGFFELAQELADISSKAREKGLSMADMQGGCFTISSLGGIGGTAFTPIINAPEVAILGVSRSYQKPAYQKDGTLVPKLMLPLSLSYDHRVIDGADGARFLVYLTQLLADIRTLLL